MAPLADKFIGHKNVDMGLSLAHVGFILARLLMLIVFYSFYGNNNQFLRVVVLHYHWLYGVFPVSSASHGYGTPICRPQSRAGHVHL
jgi:hypothetical protein